MESDSQSSQPTHYMVKEEITFGVPLVRPKTLFLEILRHAGATGEIFTKKEICNFLKNYIGTRRLYNTEDPRIVHCSEDLLGAVFGVESFTIDDVLKLIEENVTYVPDTCLKTKTHFVKKPLPADGDISNLVCKHLGGLSQTVSHKTSSSSSSSHETNGVSSSENCDTGTSETVILSDNSVTSATVAKKKKEKKKQKRQRKRKRSEDEPGPSSKRNRSVSITYGDGENGDYIQVEVEEDDDDGEEEDTANGILQVGSNLDDLWYFDEGSLTVDIDSDQPFSESDINSIRSGEELLVVCQESDVEFFADYSDTDSNSDDRELTQADNWTCIDCDLSNPPYQRFCNKCWKLRPDWLPWQQQISPDSKSKKVCEDKVIDQSVQTKGNKTISGIFDTKMEDSGVGSFSSQHSSQESEHCLSTRAASTMDLSATLLKEETGACEIRHSLSNYQSKLLKSSMLSKMSSSSIDSLCSETKEKSFSPLKAKSSPLDDPCIICLTNPKTASLIHGSSGHQVCCFPCAKRLKRRGKVCPVCRRPIQKVIKNYIL